MSYYYNVNYGQLGIKNLLEYYGDYNEYKSYSYIIINFIKRRICLTTFLITKLENKTPLGERTYITPPNSSNGSKNNIYFHQPYISSQTYHETYIDGPHSTLC